MKTVLLDLVQAHQHYNRQYHEVLAQETQASLEQDQKAFFGSIFGTLNHILVVDKMLMGRLTGQHFLPKSFKDPLAPDAATLWQLQAQSDQALIDLVTAEANPARMINFTAMNGKSYAQPYYHFVMSITQHGTHHRGQISNMCHQRGIPIPDFSPLTYFRERT